MVRLELLGPPRVVTEAGVSPLPETQVGCLLAYIAVEPEWVKRDVLLTLFWPDQDETSARTNLRQLFRSVPEPYRAHLERDVDTVRLTVSLDVADADLAEAAGAWPDVARLHRGPFMDRFSPKRAPGFSAWLDGKRGLVERQWQRAARRAFEGAVRASLLDEATVVATRWVERDPLEVDVVLEVAAGLVDVGAHATARALLERHVAAVHAAELPVADEVEAMLCTTGTDASSRSRRARRSSSASTGTRLVGRAEEIARLERWWQGPGRWLTLSAPGGMGKTALATAFAARLHDAGIGVDVVRIAGVDDPERATHRALDALRLGGGRVVTDIGGALGDAVHLLVVDEAEALPANRLPFADWLAQAPGLRLLVTSRRSWNDPANETMLLAGLPTMAGHDGASPAAAMVWHAARAAWEDADAPSDGAPDLAPTGPAEGNARVPAVVERAVRRLGGWPLGLELVAGWARWMGRDAWFAALDARPEDLATGERSGAVIAASWQYLEASRRADLSRLAALPTPWTAEDAVSSADVTPSSLRDLVASGWVAVTGDAFTLHPLIAEHAGAVGPAEVERVRARHAANVTRSVAERFAMSGRFPGHTPERWPHLRLAWTHACRSRDLAAIDGLLDPLCRSLQDGTAYETWLDCLDDAERTVTGEDAAPGRERLLRRIRLWRLSAHVRTDDVERGTTLHDELIEASTRASDAYALGWLAFYRAWRAIVHLRDLSVAMAEARAGEEALSSSNDRPASFVRARLANAAGVAGIRAGDIDGARRDYERAIDLAMRAGGPPFAAEWAGNLIILEVEAGNYGRALALSAKHLRSVLDAEAVLPTVEFWRLRASALQGYGDLPSARACLEQSLAACERLGPIERRHHTSLTLSRLVEVALTEGKAGEARALLERCARTGWTFVHEARLAILEGDPLTAERAIEAGLTHVQEPVPMHQAQVLMTARLQALRAEVRVRQGDPDASVRIVEALRAARATHCLPDVARALVPAADWLRTVGDAEVARRLLLDVRAAPVTHHETRQACVTRLDDFASSRPVRSIRLGSARAVASGSRVASRDLPTWLDEVERIGRETYERSGAALDRHVLPSVP